MKDNKKARQQKTGERLADQHRIGVLAGALCGRLTLNGRVDDAIGLAQLLTDVEMVDGAEDVDTGETLARGHSATTLAWALITRLLNEGRHIDAHKLVVLFKATKVGDGDYDALVPSA